MKKRTYKSLLIVSLTVLFVFVSVGSVRAFKTKAGTMYYGLEQVVKVAWNAASGAEGYEVQLVMFDKSPITTFAPVGTLATNIELSRPRSGQFIIRVKSWNWKIKDVEKQYSEWAVSDDPQYAVVDGQPGAWWLNWQIPAIGGGGIE